MRVRRQGSDIEHPLADAIAGGLGREFRVQSICDLAQMSGMDTEQIGGFGGTEKDTGGHGIRAFLCCFFAAFRAFQVQLDRIVKRIRELDSLANAVDLQIGPDVVVDSDELAPAGSCLM